MLERSQRGDPVWIWMLHWWDIFSWAVIGLIALFTVLGDAPRTAKYGSLALLVVLFLCYLTARFHPSRSALLGYGYLIVLILVLAGLSYLREGFGILYTLALTQFILYVDNQRAAVIYSGLGAIAITLGGTLREGWSLEVLGKNTISSLAVFAVSVLLALLTPRALAVRDERARLRSQLASAEQRLAEAHQRQGAAEERERMARDIHDTLAQGFASIIVLAEAARLGLESDPRKSGQQLVSIEHTARENLAEARVLVGSAPQGGIAAGSVARALRRTLDRFTEDTEITVSAELPDIECDQQTRIALLRCTQESLANVRKHAAASHVGVVLAEHPFGVELEVTDDGRGFVLEDSEGFGLEGMRRRLAELGGRLTVTSSVGDGTRVLALIPTNAQG